MAARNSRKPAAAQAAAQEQAGGFPGVFFIKNRSHTPLALPLVDAMVDRHSRAEVTIRDKQQLSELKTELSTLAVLNRLPESAFQVLTAEEAEAEDKAEAEAKAGE